MSNVRKMGNQYEKKLMIAFHSFTCDLAATDHESKQTNPPVDFVHALPEHLVVDALLEGSLSARRVAVVRCEAPQGRQACAAAERRWRPLGPTAAGVSERGWHAVGGGERGLRSVGASIVLGIVPCKKSMSPRCLIKSLYSESLNSSF